MPARQLVITAKVLIEPGAESPERTYSYVQQALKTACRNIRDGSVVISLYDDKGELIGMDMTGVPSAELQKRVEELTKQSEGRGQHNL